MNDVGMCSSLSATPVLASASLSPTAMDAGEDAAPLQLDDVIGIVLSHLCANAIPLAPPSRVGRQFRNAEQLALKLSILRGRAELARMSARLRAVSKNLRALTDLGSALPRVNGALLWEQARAIARIARIVEILSWSERMRSSQVVGVRLEELCTPDTGNIQWPAYETPAELAAPERWVRLRQHIENLVSGRISYVNISAILEHLLPQVARRHHPEEAARVGLENCRLSHNNQEHE
jgi:hypothetical protein